MPDLNFRIEAVEAVSFAEIPLLHFKLEISNANLEESIHSVLLRCQIQIEVRRRTYSQDEKSELIELFGPPDSWGRNLQSLLWTHVNVTVPAFNGSISVDLPVHCTFDFNVATTKYFAGLEDGLIPLSFLFSGTVFYHGGEKAFQIAQIPWEKEANYRLPIGIWQKLMDTYYPNSAWLQLRRDAFERLRAYRKTRGLPTWEQALEHLLSLAETGGVGNEKPFKKGDRVRLKPQGRADILDSALEGRIATVESVEQDFEDKIYVVVTLEDDPGQDLGMMHHPGHRFFFSPDEVEPVRLDENAQ